MEHEFQFFDDNYVLEEEEFEDEGSGSDESGEGRILKVRLDKWLWAARFFKTRAVARAAVEKGKVFYNGERSRPSREIEIGATLQIRHGRFEKTVIVKGLSTRRRCTEEALALFEETEDSRLMREQISSFQQTEEYPRERRVIRFLRRAVDRHDQPRYEQPHHDQPRYDQPRHDQPRYDQPRHAQPRYERTVPYTRKPVPESAEPFE